MGCGLISQRAPSVEVHHPLSNDPATRAAGARVVRVPPTAEAPVPTRSSNRHAPGDRQSSQEPRNSAPRVVPEAAARPGGRPVNRRFRIGDRILLSSRLPRNLQDHAFCFECGAFFQLPAARTPQCTRCNSNFVQYLATVGSENWVGTNSSNAASFSFDDQLDNSITASLDETPAPKKPTQAAFVRGLPALQLAQTDMEERAALDTSDPRRQCSICRENFRSGDTLKQLPCTHEFHENCIVPWLQSNNTCPICRLGMPEGLDGDDDEDNVVTLRPPADREHSAGNPSGLSRRQSSQGQGCSSAGQTSTITM